MHKILTTLLAAFFCFTLSAQLIDFEYVDTFRYSENNFVSPNTVLNDIADNGTMIGSYEDANGFLAGLVILPDGEVTSYQYVGFNNTELTGINDAGFVVGRAYDSPLSAIIFQARIINGIVDQAVELNWNDPVGASKKVGRLNDDDVAVGTARISNNDWLHFESIISPFSVDQSERFSTTSPFTTYYTYGLGLNNNAKYTGWYLDGVNRVPYVFDGISDAFFPLAHYPSGSASLRTFLNDINDNNRVAVSYRQSNGAMAGTVAQYNGATSINYDTQFQFITLNGCEILGINDNDDVVGYYENANGHKVGLYILTEGPTLDDFVLAEDILLFGNSSSIFEYTNGDFDYFLRDEYLDIADSFYVNHLSNISFAFTAEQQLSINTGQRNPSWPAFVRSRAEDRSYITQNDGTKIPRSEALVKWLEKSDDEFTGYCFGISAFALQNLSDPNLLLGRFGNVYTPEINAVNYNPTNLAFKEMLATLQFQQLDERFDSVRIYQGALISAANDNNTTAVAQLMSPFTSDIIEGLKGGDPDSAYVMCFKVNSPQSFFHAVTPFKVTREVDLSLNKDTFHCIDPNYDGNVLKVFVDYAGGNSRAYIGNTLVYAIDFVYHTSYLRDIMPETVADFSGGQVSNQEHKSGNPDQTAIHVGELCDYSISNNANGAQSISQASGELSINWEAVGTFANMDADGQVDFLIGDGVLDITANLSACSGRNKFSYTHPEGTFVYVRNDVLMGETDIVQANGNVQSVENIDNIEKELDLLVISSEQDDTETSVHISAYDLNQGEVVTIETINAQQFELSNDENDDKTYNLEVNFVNPDYLIQTSLEVIPLGSETSHTIIVQPEVSGEEVVILVDEGLDGSIEDTLFGSLQPTLIRDLIYVERFTVYPNPTKDVVQIDLALKEKQKLSIGLCNTLGQEMKNMFLPAHENGQIQLDLVDLPRGVYFLRVKNQDGKLIAVQRVVKE